LGQRPPPDSRRSRWHVHAQFHVPIGTHFLWHICNAIVLYLLAHAAILHGRAARHAREDLALR
jgi:hypothetical protein